MRRGHDVTLEFPKHRVTVFVQADPHVIAAPEVEVYDGEAYSVVDFETLSAEQRAYVTEMATISMEQGSHYIDLIEDQYAEKVGL